MQARDLSVITLANNTIGQIRRALPCLARAAAAAVPVTASTLRCPARAISTVQADAIQPCPCLVRHGSSAAVPPQAAQQEQTAADDQRTQQQTARAAQ